MFPSNDPWPWRAAFRPKTNFAHLLNNEREKCGGISGTHWLELHEVLLNLSGNSVNYKIGCSAEDLLSTTSLAFHLKWNIKSLIVELHTNNAKHLLKHLSQADRKELLRRKCVWSAQHATKHIKIAYWRKKKKKKNGKMHFDASGFWSDALLAVICRAWHAVCSFYLNCCSNHTQVHIQMSGTICSSKYAKYSQIYSLLYCYFAFFRTVFFSQRVPHLACIFPSLFVFEKSKVKCL